jgi:anti-sigma regulatory factor (Ser/Thr protein kinase)
MSADEPGERVLETVAAPEALDEVHILFARLWADVADVSPKDRMAFETAVAEVAANIIEHSARGEPVALRLALRVDPDVVAAELEDGGRGLDGGAFSTSPDDERGRGLMLASALTDELSYERDGSLNRWRLRRHR